MARVAAFGGTDYPDNGIIIIDIKGDAQPGAQAGARLEFASGAIRNVGAESKGKAVRRRGRASACRACQSAR